MDKEQFSEETIQALKELAESVRPVVERLVREGKAKIVDGKIIFLNEE